MIRGGTVPAYANGAEGYVAGRASAAVEIMESRDALKAALDREKRLQSEFFALKIQHEQQQWVSIVAVGGCACLILVCIALWAQLYPVTY